MKSLMLPFLGHSVDVLDGEVGGVGGNNLRKLQHCYSQYQLH